jgi:hypothetical protein
MVLGLKLVRVDVKESGGGGGILEFYPYPS